MTKTVKLDSSPPSLSGSPTTSPNADGWYSGDVTIHWTCSDTISGIDGACPADSTIPGEGNGLTAGASVSDKAGNTTTASSSPVNIDRTAPVTTAGALPVWNNTDVTVTLSPSDNLSGLAATRYTIDGGSVQTGTSIPFSAEGSYSLEFWSVDKAGNEEGHHTVLVKIDKTPPTITHTQLPLANGKGWNNTDVTVTFTCDDALSGIFSCTDPQTVSTEGSLQPVTGTAVDNAGNSATDPATVSIDATDPTIVGAVAPAPNANGWNDTDATRRLQLRRRVVGDRLLQHSPGPGRGGRSVGDRHGHRCSGQLRPTRRSRTSTWTRPIRTDRRASHQTPTRTGWYDGDVTIHWTCSDALSGIDRNLPRGHHHLRRG